ncbi:hypothetical protein ABB37_03049 [Leptomonas pyrrhocoris]|uniref:Uncharacterized protein n=1 Tax=Leptomonas pyrrhocoris TaxID=157538 RepID=A0A0M9G6H2_LEPPY|nr:hypothetical protein ABB37_03049 [Leptomonas pyrrhocoris]XP_015661853.1 hypothetical protein ABB37_03049 [Leptomonas pyrrhocoris]KPA83413.1 hypothetical protein ABB37_03049 [Leptomonas pyrrhocoris]KPA83414.1 hypothetical protein ABB37_03049 [Leptomonas pyrrhocoris]|eukprot:XP_015661852.1 hypothetical protein ABB37_03049 [Leptomonas pyrrhocoris]
MSGPRPKQKVPAEGAGVRAVRIVPPAAALSLSRAPPASVDDFCEEDRPLLSFIALSAAQSATARSAEVVLDAVLTPLKGSSPAPVQQANPLTSLNTTNTEGDSLAGRYPEVLVLLHLHCLRCALRDLQECPTHARRTFVSILERHLTALAEVLPDPLFVAVASVLRDSLASTAEDALDQKRCHALEVQLLHVVEATQVELLRATKLLSVRAGVLTLRFHHSIPYL